MELRKILKIAVIAHLLLSIIGYFTTKTLVPYLPKQLRDYEILLSKQESTNIDLLIIVVMTTLLLGYLISLVGLFFILPWSKWFYTTVILLMIIFLLFLGPIVDHALSNVISSLESIATGIIFCLLFFTNVMSDDRGNSQVGQALPANHLRAD